MANGLFKKKNFGAITNNSQSSTDNTADNEIMSCQVTSDEDETPEQHCSDPLDQEGLTSTDEPIHVVHTRSKTPSKPTPPAAKEPEDSTNSIAVADSELHTPTQEQATSQTSPAMSSEPAAQVASIGQPSGIDNTQDSQPADSLTPSKTPLAPPIPQPSKGQDMSPGGQPQRTRIQSSTAQLQAPLAPPLPPPTQEQQAMSETDLQRRTRRPPQDGKKTLTARIDKELHSRVKEGAKARNISLPAMVIAMIENCFPTP